MNFLIKDYGISNSGELNNHGTIKINTTIYEKDPNTIINKTPTPKHHFFGRQNELAKIHKELEKNDIVFVYGVGGIGKSELTKKYIDEHKDDYQAIVFISYNGDIINSLISGVEFSRTNINGGTVKKRYKNWKSALRSCDISNGLIVIDGVDKKCSGFNDTIDFLAEMGFKLLISSRIKSHSGYQTIEIKAENSDKLFEFFIEIAELNSSELSIEERDTIYSILSTVDNHTMAIELLALQYKNSLKDLTTYYADLQNGIDKTKAKVNFRKDSIDDAFETTNYFIDALFDLSELDRKAIELFKVLCLAPADGIKIVHLIKALNSDEDIINTINQLVNLGWIQRVGKKIQLHAVIDELILINFTPSFDEENQKKYIEFIINNIEFCLTDYNQVREYLDYLLGYANKIKRISDKKGSNKYTEIARLLLNYGLYDLALSVAQYGADVFKNSHGESTPYLVAIYNEIANLYTKKGNQEQALLYCEYAFAILQKQHGENALEASKNCTNFGLVYSEKGDFKKALDYFKRALEILEADDGKDLQFLAMAYNNIGAAYSKFGDTGEALKYYEKAFPLMVSIHGKYHPDMAANCNNIAIEYLKQFKFDKALEFHQYALEIRKKVYGENHPYVGMSYREISLVYFQKRQLDPALKNAQIALDIYNKSDYVEKPLNVAQTYEIIGNVYMNISYFNKALHYFHRVLEIYKNLGEAYQKDIERVEDWIDQIKNEF